MHRLDFGGGNGYGVNGFKSVDVVGRGYIHDMNNFPYPFDNNSTEVVHCSHTLEHLTKQSAKLAISEFYRILCPGGILTIAVPDMDWFIDRYLSGDWSGVPEYLERDMNLCIGAEIPDPSLEFWRHRYMWCWESLAYCLQEVGFVEIERHGHDDSRHAHLWASGAYNKDFAFCSLYVDAMKPR